MELDTSILAGAFTIAGVAFIVLAVWAITKGRKFKDDRVEIWKGISGQWHWHRQAAGNNEIISSGEGFLTKQGALNGAFRANPDQRKVYVRVVDELEGTSHDDIVKRTKYLSR